MTQLLANLRLNFFRHGSVLNHVSVYYSGGYFAYILSALVLVSFCTFCFSHLMLRAVQLLVLMVYTYATYKHDYVKKSRKLVNNGS
jgi:hypothetical protein